MRPTRPSRGPRSSTAPATTMRPRRWPPPSRSRPPASSRSARTTARPPAPTPRSSSWSGKTRRTSAERRLRMAGLFDLPPRSGKPRTTGLTHVLDRGMSLAQVDGLVQVAGASVDIVKLAWGTALATANLEPKLERFRAHGIPVVLGGTLTELAIRDGRLDALVGWLRTLGLEHVEGSDGTITLSADDKRAL